MTNAPETITLTTGDVKGLVDAPHAPFLFFDNVPSKGTLEGIVTVTLSAQAVLQTADGKGTRSIPVVVAYLRTNKIGARILRDALNVALDLGDPATLTGEPPQGPAN